MLHYSVSIRLYFSILLNRHVIIVHMYLKRQQFLGALTDFNKELIQPFSYNVILADMHSYCNNHMLWLLYFAIYISTWFNAVNVII